ncbi:hypothetical protein HanRHA438_Chr06g0268731 [Helianthus annuus]|nr:hypothetical protein HanIR_Chr06g0279391 [Helianthus annuus]KAJ0911940.1 hypothetical protein HanRHA438_Chr06g0268731 [Helianthus annuus]
MVPPQSTRIHNPPYLRLKKNTKRRWINNANQLIKQKANKRMYVQIIRLTG